MELLSAIDILFGWVDLGILLLVVIINILIWKNKIKTNSWFYILTVICFVFVLPFLSATAELKMYDRGIGGLKPDAHELLYVYLRFPTYWIIGVIEIISLLIMKKNKSTPNNVWLPV